MYDANMAEAAGGATALDTLRADPSVSAQLLALEAQTAPQSFEFVAMLPIILLVLFGAIWLNDRLTKSKLATSEATGEIA